MSTPWIRPALACLVAAIALGGCSTRPGKGPTPAQTPGPPPASATGSASAPAQAPGAPPAPSAAATPTSTGTIPPPPRPTGPAATRAGNLDEGSVPVPPRWNKVARPGGADEGFIGNGTWVHDRPPVNAAYEILAVGCKPVEVDAYAPPKAALAGTLAGSADQPGNTIALEFAEAAAARTWYEQLMGQLQACTAPGSSPKVNLARRGDQFFGTRDYGAGQVWTEFGKVSNTKVVLFILADPAYAPADAEATLAKAG